MSNVVNQVLKYQSLLLIALIWEIFALLHIFPEQLFPSVEKIVVVMVQLLFTVDLWSNIAVTLYRILGGFFLAAIVGVPLGIFMSRSAKFDNIMQPLVTIGYPIPRVALYPIFVLIFGLGSGSKIFTIFLECIYPIIVNTYYGAKRVDKIHIWSGQNMGASDKKLFWKVFLPGTMPAIFTGFRIALPIAVVIAVLAEMISSTDGVGYLLTYLSASLAQDQVLAVVIIISLVGFTLDRILLTIKNKFVFW